MKNASFALHRSLTFELTIWCRLTLLGGLIFHRVVRCRQRYKASYWEARTGNSLALSTWSDFDNAPSEWSAFALLPACIAWTPYLYTSSLSTCLRLPSQLTIELNFLCCSIRLLLFLLQFPRPYSSSWDSVWYSSVRFPGEMHGAVPSDESWGKIWVSLDDDFWRKPANQVKLTGESQWLNRGSRNRQGQLRQHPMLAAVVSAIRASHSSSISVWHLFRARQSRRFLSFQYFDSYIWRTLSRCLQIDPCEIYLQLWFLK